MKYSKVLLFLIIVGLWTSCGKDGTPSDSCSGVPDKNCSELTAEDFERLCNAKNLTVSLTSSNSSSFPLECKYKIRNDDGVVLLITITQQILSILMAVMS